MTSTRWWCGCAPTLTTSGRACNSRKGFHKSSNPNQQCVIAGDVKDGALFRFGFKSPSTGWLGFHAA
ncbi:hypothetical protein [Streptomyces sp. NPDC057496]|uniref:hypothetical protein n=1 Tax=Streptomyces sp. NPDC057496 TaxID=3346149 RepID=UPI003697B06D